MLIFPLDCSGSVRIESVVYAPDLCTRAVFQRQYVRYNQLFLALPCQQRFYLLQLGVHLMLRLYIARAAYTPFVRLR